MDRDVGVVLARTWVLFLFYDVDGDHEGVWLSCDDWRERELSHATPGVNMRVYRSWTTSWDQGRAQVLCTDTTKSNHVVHWIITFCTLPYKTRRRGGASSEYEYKEETRMGRMETGQRGRQGKIHDKGDGSRRERRRKMPRGGPETD